MPAARSCPRFSLSLAFAWAVASAWPGPARAQGGSAVITLVMPPPGGEGYTALQSGAAVAEGATAAYYNPAALAELNRTTGNSVGATYSAEDLLPILDLPDLNHEFEAADIRPRFSLGRHGIYSEHTGIRNGQESWYLSFSL